MPQRNLANLPVEILGQIASLVRDTHKPSLYAFSATNKPYRLACMPLIFHEVRVSVNDGKALQNDIDLLLKLLLGTVCGDGTQHVRHLSLEGSLSLWKSDGGEATTTAMDPDELERTANHDENLQRFRSEGLDELMDENEPFVDKFLGEEDPFVTPEQDAAWAPVANLIKELPKLTKLVYNCRNQFPPMLLSVLHSHHPQCRLYHHTFRLRSLRSKFAHRLDPHELAVATSPCLYSVKLRCSNYNEDGEKDPNPQAILELIASLAPNLKEVFVVHNPPPQSKLREADQPHGLPGFVRGQTGSLTLLSINGTVPPRAWWPSSFQTWPNHTDFTSLRHLSLGGAYHQGTRESRHGVPTATLEFMARTCSFPQLESLHILLMRPGLLRKADLKDVDPPANGMYINAATAFFGSLRPLRKLSVAGSILPEIFDTILGRHGRTVVDLKLCPFEDIWGHSPTRDIVYLPMTITKAHILQIEAHCPVLESLSIYTKRTMSDPSEVELYTSLARIKPLHFLFLTLDCSNWRVRRDPDLEDEEWFDEDDRQPFLGNLWTDLKRGHVRQNMINCAVDETLARSIWDVIAKHKDGKRLLALKLYTSGAMNFGWPGRVPQMADVAYHLSRSWLIERGVPADKQDALHVRELGLQARKARDKALHEKFEDEKGMPNYYSKPGVDAFRRTWPEKEIGRPWMDDWTSYPLQI